MKKSKFQTYEEFKKERPLSPEAEARVADSLKTYLRKSELEIAADEFHKAQHDFRLYPDDRALTLLLKKAIAYQLASD